MCGISGVVAPVGLNISGNRLQLMTEVIAHRGPDGAGLWISEDCQVGLGHRRLSIIDLSEAGAQPMTSPSGRYIATFNGEIYNYIELKNELLALGATFKGHSDTEVMLAGFDLWGIRKTVEMMAGMFAIGVWDRSQEIMTLVRDRVGIKPLYYSSLNGGLTFASEVRAIVLYQGELPKISIGALHEYLRFGFVPGPRSIFEGISKLQPGHLAEFHRGILIQMCPYWSFSQVAKRGIENQLQDQQIAINSLDSILRKSIKRHMIADVPVGAFLSGGIDSSAVVALMQEVGNRQVKTFTIGFHEQGYDEAKHAAVIAKHLGTEHYELYVNQKDAMSIIPDLPCVYDEPFADASQIPTLLVSKLAKKNVTVVLSGDGGDELFAGYSRYHFVANFWKGLDRIPSLPRSFLSKFIMAISVGRWDSIYSTVQKIVPFTVAPALPGQKMHKMASVLGSSDIASLHQRLVSQWPEPKSVLHSRIQTCSGKELFSKFAVSSGYSDIEQQMIWDSENYLVDDILTKVDRASMSFGLEARVPLLDHEVIDLAWKIPIDMKFCDGRGKWILREVLNKYIPKFLVDRPKMGFSVPIDAWIRGPLRPWVESTLSSNRLRDEGIFDEKQVSAVMNRHFDGSVNFGGQLWTLLMFQLWWQKAKTWI